MIPVAILAINNEDDRSFMERIYLDYRRLMYSIAYQILRDHFSTEDVINTTCEALCKKIPLLRSFDKAKLQAYIVFSCKNRALNALKARKRRNARLFYDIDALDNTISSNDTVIDHLIREAEIAELVDALNQLASKERDILQQKYLLQKSDVEIASIYGIKPDSVRYYLTLARRHLGEVMKRNESV